jgi:hypothetical protein
MTGSRLVQLKGSDISRGHPQPVPEQMSKTGHQKEHTFHQRFAEVTTKVEYETVGSTEIYF